MILGKLSTEKFIQQYWQQKPVWIPAAYAPADELISKQDLLAMARAAECESRLVLRKGKASVVSGKWHAEQGPFTAKRLKQLPPSGWTILVQAVDQWIPEVADLLKQFDFLPRWRLDDIMISIASDGGGVGPHFDYYDVFLLQASGQRRWQIGQHCDEHSALCPQTDLRLLKHFEAKEDYLLSAGDMLYIPAGTAHWGTAVGDDCITVSIGFRAASQRELVQLALEKLASNAAEHLRYRDTPAAMDKDPYCINDAAVQNAQQLWNAISEQECQQVFAQALGISATEPRYPDHVQPPKKSWTEKSLRASLAKRCGAVHHVASRFAYRRLDAKAAELFVNGEMYSCSLALAKLICQQQDLPKTLSGQDLCLLLELLNQGCLSIRQGIRKQKE